jgi:hypothetical protein
VYTHHPSSISIISLAVLQHRQSAVEAILIVMGRSQVERNRAARGGRGAGRGGGGGGRGRRHKQKIFVDGDNSFRYINTTTDDDGAAAAAGDDNNDDDYTSWLFDDSANDGGFNFLGGGDEDDDDIVVGNDSEGRLVTEILRSIAVGSSKQKQDSNKAIENTKINITSIDIQQLNACLKQIPIHQRLRLPHYIGRHLEDRYGLGVGTSGRGGITRDDSKMMKKKTLGQLREESRCIVRDEDDDEEFEHRKNNTDGIIDKLEDLPVTASSFAGGDDEKHRWGQEGDASGITTSGVGVGVAVPEPIAKENEDDDDNDLEAWLDDMIA